MPKDEELAPDEFICKCCWKKIKSSVKYEIAGYLFFTEDNGWQKSKTKFVVCYECFSGMLGFIDQKSEEIIERISNSEPIKSPEDTASLHRFKVYVQKRLSSLESLLQSVNNKLGLKGENDEKGTC